MRILVFGATGNAGSRIVAEAVSRGHETTAVVREGSAVSAIPDGVVTVVGDAAQASDVEKLSIGFDIVISATRPAPGQEEQHAVMASALVEGTRTSRVRSIIVGGAANLIVPDSGGVMAIDDPQFVPPQWQPVAAASFAQLTVFREAGQACDWTYVSPQVMFEPGVRTGRFRLGREELLLDADGKSWISMEDFAIAVMDEAERPQHRHACFTVGY